MPTVVMYWITMKKYTRSTTCMVEEFGAGRDLRLGMVHVTSKLCMHKWISRMYVGAPDSLPAFTTSRGAFKTVSVDSAHCLLNRYGNGR